LAGFLHASTEALLARSFEQNRELRSRVEGLAMENKQLKAMTKSSPFKRKVCSRNERFWI
jgi:uncharacterized protein (DUF3084 family)